MSGPFCTAVFAADLSKHEGNPFHAETPFGRPVALGIGDVMGEAHDLEGVNAELIEALQGLLKVIRAAGLSNLANGVQLGQTSWFIKASDAMDAADLAIAKATGGEA